MLTAVAMLGRSHQATAQTTDQQSCEKDSGDVAIAACARVIRENPKHAKAYHNRGIAWHKKGDYDRAIADFSEAIRLEPHPLVYFNRGVAWTTKGEHDKAITDYNEAIRLEPKFGSPYINRGIIAWVRKGDYDKAITDFSEAIRLNPRIATAYVNRGSVWNAKGEYDKAVADFNEAIRLNPQLQQAYAGRGDAWIRKSYYDNAIVDFNEAIRLNPQSAFAYYNRGKAWDSKGDYDKAIADYTDAIRLDPQDANAKENLELTLLKQKIKTQRAAVGPQQRPASPPSSNGKRVALVIGNSNYKIMTTLENPSKDAELVAKSLKAVGFDDVVVKLNLTRLQMMAALKDFEKVSETADWAAIYFAGHGVEVSGVNYLVPIDAQFAGENSISTQTVNLQYLLNSVEVAKRMRLVILDACRNNPYAQKIAAASASRGAGGATAAASSVGRGLSRVEPQPGTLVVYSAKAGSLALDGDGKNSPFAEALAKRIEQKPPIEVRRLFDFVRQDVFAATKKEQTPFSYGSLEASEDFFFAKQTFTPH